MTATLLDPLDYYAGIHASLFPIPAGSKNPTGIVSSFKSDHSSDPAQWRKWAADHACNFGIVAFASRLIIVDIDVKIGRDEAWAAWCQLCNEWGLSEVAMPHCASPSGGWHVYFAVPSDVDASKLRQPDALKKIINTRCIGYTVAAGSTFEGRPYTLLSSQPPHAAPPALIEHCTRKPAPVRAATILPGSRDPAEVAALLNWLNEHNAFAAYEDWIACGMALALEYGSDGFDLWSLCHDETVTPDTATAKWESFATEPDANSVTLLTFIDRAAKQGWRGQIRKTAAAMFDGVAQLAANAGASLPGPMPMMVGQEELARLGTPMLADFMAATKDSPIHPSISDLPSLPQSLANHGLFQPLNDAIIRIFALASMDKFKPARVVNPLAVLHETHLDVYAAAIRRLEGMGHHVPVRKVKQVAKNLEESVQRITVTLEKWEYDPKSGQIENDNPDNVRFGLEYLGLELRWNAWIERMQIKGWGRPSWTNVDDALVVALLTRFRQTKTRFRPAKEFLWDTLFAVAHENEQDPVLETLSDLATKWDRQPRLITWLARYCGTPCDIYHQAVGKLIVGGMVMRARKPGCKFDFMPVFYGKQGTGKSSMVAALAQRIDWFSDTVLLGDASKELVLTLAGKLVVEVSEMGMRSSADINHIKAMVTRQVDAGRTAYARSVTERPRRNIFAGTTNEDHPLSDPTGNRRFLPVHVEGEIDLAAFRAEVPQLIGEAAVLEASGYVFDLPRNVWTSAIQYQEAARGLSALEETCHDWFDRDGSLYILSADMMNAFRMAGFGINVRPGVYLKKLGWRSAQVGANRNRVWIKHPNNDVTKCLKLVPSQAHVNGRVDMRVRASDETAAPGFTPPVPER